jgi:hypothetical protein
MEMQMQICGKNLQMEIRIQAKDATAEAHAGVEDVALALENADAARDGEENAEEEEGAA